MAKETNMQSKGKIARRPRPVREEISLRLADNEDGAPFLEWLNAIHGVPAVLAPEFAGDPVSHQTSNSNPARAGLSPPTPASPQAQPMPSRGSDR